ncbi:lipoprotein signal peptidase [Actinobacteria bacterium IMCC26207]|nr:lipoprotein signal peptidase [Actinobacteria bacterium IMCC26207]
MESVPLTSHPPKISALQRWGAVGLATLSVVAIDQLSKAWALRRLSSAEVVDVVFSLRFNLAFNTGMAFSKGAGKGPLIGLVALVVAGVLLFIARKSTSILQLVFIGIVVGGAVGNVIDRMSRVGEAPNFGGTGFMSGAVVDFIDLQWWPIFNVADAAIVVGGIGLVLIGIRAPIDEDTAASASTDDQTDAATDSAGADSADG